jgi:hypothetical protein
MWTPHTIAFEIVLICARSTHPRFYVSKLCTRGGFALLDNRILRAAVATV